MLNSKNIRKLYKEAEFAKLFNFFGFSKDDSEYELQALAEMLNETHEYGCATNKYVWAYVEDLISRMIDKVNEEE